MRKLLCSLKYRVTTEGKNNVYEIDSSKCKAVYFSESKRSLKSRLDEHKRSIRNCGCDKNETKKHCYGADHNFSWDQKTVDDRESKLTPRKLKQTMHSLNNSNHIKKMVYTLLEIWITSLQ